ncbi:hypothetical protein [Tautonia sociabilis]|uniref:Uncharacterized protein n=1 Tax=Tautonia sociabilis TaxID=2080755 RepID=A0A432ME69_9BACT|nr:hypothetical protein [Tautonia sociabilis]RUL83507.1 hypothetical protein TsocGM_22060 [Tautonia sociabilis]
MNEATDPGRRKDETPDEDAARRERRWTAIAAKLHDAEYWRSTQGGLARKVVDDRDCWVVRYVVLDGGRRRHRSMRGGHPRVVAWRGAAGILPAACPPIVIGE